MRFAVISASKAKTFIPKNPDDVCIHISIRGWNDKKVRLANNPNRVASLFLQFDDIEQGDPHFVSYILFDRKMAREILGFVKFWTTEKPEIDLIIVNCEAGVSRSAGVAAALSMIFNGDDAVIFGDPSFSPNSWVRSVILKEHFGEGSAFGEVEVPLEHGACSSCSAEADPNPCLACGAPCNHAYCCKRWQTNEPCESLAARDCSCRQ